MDSCCDFLYIHVIHFVISLYLSLLIDLERDLQKFSQIKQVQLENLYYRSHLSHHPPTHHHSELGIGLMHVFMLCSTDLLGRLYGDLGLIYCWRLSHLNFQLF
jgi:hypothetical protein